MATIYFYKDDKDQKKSIPCGTIVIYFLESTLRKLKKQMGAFSSEEDTESVYLDMCGEICNVVAGALKNKLHEVGYMIPYISTPTKAAGSIQGGTLVPKRQKEYHEMSVVLFDMRGMLVDIILDI